MCMGERDMSLLYTELSFVYNKLACTASMYNKPRGANASAVAGESWKPNRYLPFWA